jgi:hypothetical protein
MANNNTVTATIARNLRDAGENRLTIMDSEGTTHNFKIGPEIHLQTDGQKLMFSVEIIPLDTEGQRKFIRALSGF